MADTAVSGDTAAAAAASASAAGTAAAPLSDGLCATPGCGKAATLACPTCIELQLAPTRFCSQSCFKSSWRQHKADVHLPAQARRDFVPPPFAYTGALRPHFVSPMRSVPEHIGKPDYALTGTPSSELRLRGSTAIHICSAAEVAGIRLACRVGREVLDFAHSLVRVGVTTEEIDSLVHARCLSLSAYPSPLNYHRFPKSCCTSVNEVICHGIPDCRPLQDGDIVNVDISVFVQGFHGDLNETFTVGQGVDADSRRLIRCSHDAMMQAVAAVRPGAFCRDFGELISRFCHKQGFSVVRAYCGHGIGRLFHSAPNIPHYARNKAVGQLKPGMVFTIEPMVNAGLWQDVTWPDNWTSATADGRRSAQFEHTVLVTEGGCEVLTARVESSPPLWWEQEDRDRDRAAAGGPGHVKEEKNGQ